LSVVAAVPLLALAAWALRPFHARQGARAASEGRALPPIDASAVRWKERVLGGRLPVLGRVPRWLGMGAIVAEGNNFTKQIAAVFAAKRAGKDISEPVAKLEAALKLLRAGGVDEYGPMKYALSLQMGTRQFYQRPPNSDVTEDQKTIIKQALEQMKQMG
jgi:hypothetical protein